jgi:hypothetical protein
MNYCSNCGSPVVLRVPEGEHLPRHVCPSCTTIHYQNPKLVVGCVPEHDGRILLCRRAIEPRVGFWTIPAGFMENGETLQQAAARESQEEALADVEIGSLPVAAFGAGPESLEVKLVTPDEIPWQDIAFASTDFTLRRYLEDRAAGVERHHFAEFNRRAP